MILGRLKDHYFQIIGAGFLIVASLLVVCGAQAEPAPNDQVDTARIESIVHDLMAMDPADQKAAVEKMPVAEARALRDYLRSRAIQNDPSSGAIFYLYDHLANVAAIDLSERRMQKLIIVFGVTLLLFSTFLVYILFAQNRLVRRILSSSGGREVPSAKDSRSPAVYRGDQDG